MIDSSVCFHCYILQCQLTTAIELLKNELEKNNSSSTVAIIDAGCPLVTNGIIHLCNYLNMPLVSTIHRILSF